MKSHPSLRVVLPSVALLAGVLACRVVTDNPSSKTSSSVGGLGYGGDGYGGDDRWGCACPTDAEKQALIDGFSLPDYLTAIPLYPNRAPYTMTLADVPVVECVDEWALGGDRTLEFRFTANAPDVGESLTGVIKQICLDMPEEPVWLEWVFHSEKVELKMPFESLETYEYKARGYYLALDITSTTDGYDWYWDLKDPAWGYSEAGIRREAYKDGVLHYGVRANTVNEDYTQNGVHYKREIHSSGEAERDLVGVNAPLGTLVETWQDGSWSLEEDISNNQTTETWACTFMDHVRTATFSILTVPGAEQHFGGANSGGFQCPYFSFSPAFDEPPDCYEQTKQWAQNWRLSADRGGGGCWNEPTPPGPIAAKAPQTTGVQSADAIEASRR